MLPAIREADWKLLRELKPLALERFCERVLSEVGGVVSDRSQSSHERYRSIFQLLDRRDRELATTFSGLRRSTALIQLAHMQSHGLLSEDELAKFSPETRERVQLLMEVLGD